MKHKDPTTGDALARLHHTAPAENQEHQSHKISSTHQTIRLPNPHLREGEKPYLPADHAFQQEAKDLTWHKSHLEGHTLGVFLYYQATERIYNFCQCCGRRIVIDGYEQTCEGEALNQACDNDLLRALETKAWLLGEISPLLESLLQEEVKRLGPTMAARFMDGEMQIEKHRVVSMDGFYAISWRLREWPHLPISQMNPQSLIGFFDFTKVVDEDMLRRGRYIGPRINPNNHEDRENWTVYPLETGESGFVYQDDAGCWRFKREQGIFGFYPQSDTLLYEDGTLVPHTRRPTNTEKTNVSTINEMSQASSRQSSSGASLELFEISKLEDSPTLFSEQVIENPCFYP